MISLYKKNVAFIIDENYVLPATVAIASLIHHNTNLQIYVLASSLSEDSQATLQSLEKNNCSIHILQVENPYEHISTSSLFKDLPANKTALIKFGLPSILKDLNTVLYLDCDLIVTKDISELFEINLGANLVAAVSDAQSQAHMKQLGVTQYFNSGVMFLNLAKMREERTVEQLVNHRINGYNKYMDQDTFCKVMYGRTLYLDIKYNTMYSTLARLSLSELKEEFGVEAKSYDELIINACIVHFSSNKKPWKYILPGLSALYRKYVNLTPYRKDGLTYQGIAKRIFNKEFYVDSSSSKISIIIPAYNAAATLYDCATSILNQTFANLELIIVNDCSTDNTAQICAELAKTDPRVIAINLATNSGPSYARKVGVGAANGDYIMFVDSDDSLVQNACELALSEAIGYDYDIVQFATSVKCDLPNYEPAGRFNKYINAKFKFLTTQECITNSYIHKTLSINLWNRLYRANIVKQAFTKVDNSFISMSEDWYITFVIYSLAKNMGFITDELYNYSYGTGLSTSKEITNLQKFKNICTTTIATDKLLTYNLEDRLIEDKELFTKILIKCFSSISYYLDFASEDIYEECLNYMAQAFTPLFTKCLMHKSTHEALALAFDKIFKSVQERYPETLLADFSEQLCTKLVQLGANSTIFKAHSKVFHAYLPSQEDYIEDTRKVAVCAIAKNENQYLVEWVEHYKDLGFDKIFLFDNNDKNGESPAEVLQPYIQSRFVEILDVRGKSNAQIDSYDWLYHDGRLNCFDWVAFFDIDEFLSLDYSKDIHEFLEDPKFEPFNCIAFNWKQYGDNELITVTNNNYSVKSRFTSELSVLSSKNSGLLNYGSKRIVRCGITDTHINSSHGPIDKQCFGEVRTSNLIENKNIKCCNVASIPVRKNSIALTLDHSYDGGHIKHYSCKTLEEYVTIKMRRGYATMFKNMGRKLNVTDFFKLNQLTGEKLAWLDLHKIYYDLDKLIQTNNLYFSPPSAIELLKQKTLALAKMTRVEPKKNEDKRQSDYSSANNAYLYF